VTSPSPAPYLELARRLEDDHRARAGSETVDVIPVIVSDLEHAHVIGQCLIGLIGGTVLGATGPVDLFLPRPGHDYVAVRSAVEASLDLSYALARRRVAVETGAELIGPGENNPTSLGGHYRLAFVSEPLPIPEEGTAEPASEPRGALGSSANASGLDVALPFGSLSGGQQAMVGLAASLLDAALVTGEFAVVLYDESGMDTTAVNACWSLIMDHLPGMRLGPLRTLVVLVGATPSVGVHAMPGRGCRYAIVEDRLLQRKPLDSARGEALAFATRQAHARVLYLGAGFSASSRLPLGNALRDSALRRLLGEVVPSAASDGRDLAKRFRAKLAGDQNLQGLLKDLSEDQFADQLTLEQVLAYERIQYPELPTLAEFAQAHARAVSAPGTSVTSLADLLQAPNGLVLVTVNFDELVESQAPGLVTAFATDEQFSNAAAYLRRYLAGEALPVPLLKLHGTIAIPDSCVVTTTQTEQGISDDRQAALEAILATDDTKVPWTYVGASMRDLDLRPILQHARFGHGLEERWVAPFLDAAVEQFADARRPYWEGQPLQSKLITETADEYLRLLSGSWQGRVPAPV
jgi:hypothetical protein